tara:strand:+ start:1140 stop:1859 length:720 start_codon:yes stop_codon:yes gene_type:complete
MKNIFIFLEGKLGVKSLIIKLVILITIFLPNNLYALSGKEINDNIKKWLATKGIKSNPQFSPNKKLTDCNQNVLFEKHYDNFKLIKVTCKGNKPWTISVKTNSNVVQIKQIKTPKFNKILVLNKSIERGNYIKKNDLTFINSTKKNIFYYNKKELIGRKVKQNLRKGQYIQPRHLFGKYSVYEGDPVVIVSRFKNTEVSTGGIAVKSGNIGDVLEVKNKRSGKIIKGILKKNKKINVFF